MLNNCMQKSMLHAGIRAQRWKKLDRKKEKGSFEIKILYGSHLDSGN